MKKIFAIALVMSAISGLAQTDKKLSEADYQRAANMLMGNTRKLIDNAIQPQWTPDNQVWYQSLTENKCEYKLLNPIDKEIKVANTRKELFPQSTSNQTEVDDEEVLSPDGKYVAFIRNWNLWIRELSTKTEKQITTDGIPDFGYATDNAGWSHSNRPVLKWSPDSKKIATFQQDQRHVSDMYLVKTTVGAPELEAWKYPLPSDSIVILIHRVVIDITNEPKVIRFKMAPDPRRGSLSDDMLWQGEMIDVAWSADAKQLVFLSTSRDHKVTNVRMANADTGDVREIFQERVATQFESGQDGVSWRYLSKTNEIIWYSERSDWGHLYLYDAVSGNVKNAISTGNYVVRDVLHVDEQSRLIYFLGAGKEANVNPYYRYLYVADLAGKSVKLLTPGEGDHTVVFSPNKKFFTDSYSQPNVPPVHELRDIQGKLISTLERTNIARLTATGWKAPQPITVKSADKRWDLYGLLFTPTNLEANKKYPVIIHIYPGPQGGSVSYWGFSAARGDAQALAELGFVVMQVEGSCNPGRSKSFHDACYGNMGENTLPDQIAALQQLAQQYSFIDLDKVGIWGHSGGGFATAAALLKYPDFFKVGVSQSGNHDNRNYEDEWGERYIGLEMKDAAGASNYEQQANQTFAKNLKGKLFIIHGGMDDNVPPYNSYLLADALIKANKDFDFLILPNARHGYGVDNYYITRRRWDYFVRQLLQAIPPKEFYIKIAPDPRLKPQE